MSSAEDAVGSATVGARRAHSLEAVAALMMTALDDLQDRKMRQALSKRTAKSIVGSSVDVRCGTL